MKRITRDRHLTKEEAAKCNAIREEIEQEKPEINARIRKQMAVKRKAKGSQSGGETLGRRICAAREALGESQVSLTAPRRRSWNLARLHNSSKTPANQPSPSAPASPTP